MRDFARTMVEVGVGEEKRILSGMEGRSPGGVLVPASGLGLG